MASIALCGEIGGKDGIFIYNVFNKSLKNIKEGIILNFGKGTTELYAACYTRNNMLISTLAYCDLKYVSFLKWSRDSKTLICVNNQIGGDGIFKFTFK